MKCNLIGVFLFTSMLFSSCGGGGNEKTESASSDSKWEKLASNVGLTDEDVKKAGEIGTKMADCYQLESKPGAMDSKMTDACDPFRDEYKNYCIEKFGTDEYSGDKPENKKVDGFRKIMFNTRDETAKAKQK